jgi:hypothetical protein
MALHQNLLALPQVQVQEQVPQWELGSVPQWELGSVQAQVWQ